MRKFFFKKIYNYIKKMKELEKENNKLYWENWDCRYLVSCYNSNFEGARGAMQEILKRQTLDEAKYYAKIGLMYMDMRVDSIKEKKDILRKEKARGSMKKIILFFILLSSPAFAYNSSYSATNFAVMNAVIVSSIVSSNITTKNTECKLLKQCISYKGGKACMRKYKCKKLQEQTNEK